MKIDGDRLAGELYNDLAERGITVRKVNYYSDGSWCIKIANKGGLFIGIPIIKYCASNNKIELRVKCFFYTKYFASFSLTEAEDKDHLINEICKLMIAKMQ